MGQGAANIAGADESDLAASHVMGSRIVVVSAKEWTKSLFLTAFMGQGKKSSVCGLDPSPFLSPRWPMDAINLADYPIADLTEPAGAAFPASCRARFRREGALALPGFLEASVLPDLVAEAEAGAARSRPFHPSLSIRQRRLQRDL